MADETQLMATRLPPPRPKSCPSCDSPIPVGSGREFRHSKWPTWRCRSCRLVFVWPLPSETLLREVYRYPEYTAVFYGDKSRTSKRRLATFSKLLEKVRESGIEGGRLLDYGCSTGPGMQAAILGGWEPTGIERDPETSEQTRRRLRLPVHTASNLADVPDIGRFQLAVLSHVLEHVLSPRDLLLQLRERLLNPGYVLIRVPNERSLASKALGSLWSWYCPPVHLYYFNVTSITSLLGRTGFRVVWTTVARGDALPLFVELLQAPARLFVELVGHPREGNIGDRSTLAVRSPELRSLRESIGDGVVAMLGNPGDSELAVLAQVLNAPNLT